MYELLQKVLSPTTTRANSLLLLHRVVKIDSHTIVAPLSRPRPLFSSLSPRTLQSYLHLSFLICPSFSSIFSPRCWNREASYCVLHKATFLPVPWVKRSGVRFWRFCFASTLLCFCSILCLTLSLLSCNGQYQPCHTHYKHSNLPVNLLWLVLDRLARDWWTLVFNESSLTVCHCKSLDIILPRT